MKFDYIYISQEFRILGRTLQDDFADEAGGQMLGWAANLDRAYAIAEYWIKGHEIPYGVKVHESHDIPVIIEREESSTPSMQVEEWLKQIQKVREKLGSTTVSI